ncbi:MAG: hypothetical protein H7066_09585, partial [Cytophagaceae bacterium]|nr:hypothetical protein [Gemmatimonadaceae bacterium]
LAAIGRALQSAPYQLALQRHAGPHPLDGGVLVFDIPSITSGAAYPWLYTRYGVYASQVRISLRPVPNDPSSAEVTLNLDLRRGLKLNLVSSAAITAGIGGASGVATAVFATKALAMAAAVAALPVLGAMAVAMGLGVVGFGVAQRYGWKKTREELEGVLTAIENDVRSEELFGVPSGRMLPAPQAPANDLSWIGGGG